MMRQLALLRFAMGSLARRRVRNLAVGLGLTFIAWYLASVFFLVDSLRHEYRAGTNEIPDITVQRLVAGRPGLLDPATAEPIREIPGVIRVHPRVWGYVFFPSLSGNLTVVAADLNDAEVKADLASLIVDGRLPEAAGDMILGRSFSDFLGMGVGTGIGLEVAGRITSLQIVGLFSAESALYDGDVLITDAVTARSLLNLGEQEVTDLAVWISTPDEATVIAKKIAAMLPQARILDKELMSRAYELTFNMRGGTVAAMLLPAFLAFLLLAWDRLTSLGPLARREVAVLKAIGWENSDILAARMWESTLLAACATAAGLLLAYVFVFLAGAPLMSSALFGWSAIYPVLNLTPAVDLMQLLSLMAWIVVPFVALSVVPAWRAAVVPAGEAVRGAR
jgi:ABC-type lipoprotein release transport system permease subunit